MCAYYRALNAITINGKFPIPIVDVIFSKLYLGPDFHKIRINLVDIEQTAFRTHQGYYAFLVMPFRLKNAPTSFQAVMNRKFVIIFFVDILA